MNWQALADNGVIAPQDLELFRYVETADEGWAIVRDYSDVARASA